MTNQLVAEALNFLNEAPAWPPRSMTTHLITKSGSPTHLAVSAR